MSTGTPEQPNPYAVEIALAAALAEITNAQDATITQAWAAAWSEISAELLDTLTEILTDAGRVNATAVVRFERFARVLAGIADHLDDLATALGVTVTNDLADVLDQAETGTVELIAAQRLARSVPGREVPTPALDAIVRRTTQQVTSTALPLADETYAIVLGELTRGVAAGDNPRQTAARMLQRAENHWNFGRSRAVTIARTETLDAYREGERVTQLAHADLLAGWVWVCHLGPRTCRSCLAMHGQVFDLEVPGPDDHQQGRCNRIPVVREEDGSVDLSWLPSAEDHFAALTPADQQAILGKAGWRAWVAGDFPIEQWTKRRTNDGWRDSQVPASPGDAGGRGGGDGRPGDSSPPEPPARVLPIDEHFVYDGALGSQGRNERFTYGALDRLGLIAPVDDPDLYFDDDELVVAEWLRGRGLAVRSVANADDLPKTPDAVIDGAKVTVEFKTLKADRMTTVRNAATEGRRQAERIVINGQPVGLPAGTADDAMGRILGLIGGVIEEIAILRGDGTSVGWTRG
ncbi:phage minor head protein [Nocardioides sp. L-11A]|uniref:phage minor head protein n=1 Tax=Nocardioides sp. L-11A TaxID=3043848 RepID=UPI00249B9653|nr:phage minor head protein [Nocardioides sp. L-11A]